MIAGNMFLSGRGEAFPPGFVFKKFGDGFVDRLRGFWKPRMNTVGQESLLAVRYPVRDKATA